VPANPAIVPIRQPDGTTLRVVTRGDEYQGWQETTDGYTIVKNRETGFYEYAAAAPAGTLRPSGIVAVSERKEAMGAPGLLPRKGLRPPRNLDLLRWQGEWIQKLKSERRLAIPRIGAAVAAAPGGPATPRITGTWAPRPVLGAKTLLVILLNFTGKDPNNRFDSQNALLKPGALVYWSKMVFGDPKRSVAAFYRDNSYGKVQIVPAKHSQKDSPDGVIEISLPQPHPNYGNDADYATESTWVNNALAEAAKFVDFRALDRNNDGTISVDEALIYFIIGGYETAAGSGLSPSIWAHRWGGDHVSVSGKKVNNWAFNGEMYDADNRMQMGVIAHEMGHAMGGLPDLYDISHTNSGLGAFSVMSGGSWGAAQNDPVPGATPVGMDAWSRHYLGWSAPRYVARGTSLKFPSAQSSDASSAVLLLNPASSTSEYWLVENRFPTGWDAGMFQLIGDWNGGLLIQHIDTNIGTQDANSFNKFVLNSHQGNVAIRPHDAKCDLLRSASENGCPTILFYDANSMSFDETSSPASAYYSGAQSRLGVKGISVPSDLMTATFESPPSAPVNSAAPITNKAAAKSKEAKTK